MSEVSLLSFFLHRERRGKRRGTQRFLKNFETNVNDISPELEIAATLAQ